MLLIKCPYCGERDQTEFSYHGEAHISRPPQPEALSEAEWGDYLFFRKNPKGAHYERWMHAHGCRRWLVVLRDTADDCIHGTYKCGESTEAGE